MVNRDGTGLRACRKTKLSGTTSWRRAVKEQDANGFTEDGDISLRSPQRQAPPIRTQRAETNPHFTADQKQIFPHKNSLFVIALDGGSLVQLTDIRMAADAEQTAASARGAGGAETGSQGRGAATEPGRDGRRRTTRHR